MAPFYIPYSFFVGSFPRRRLFLRILGTQEVSPVSQELGYFVGAQGLELISSTVGIRYCDYHGPRTKKSQNSDKSQTPISNVTVTGESGIGKNVTKSNRSQNPIVAKSDKHCTPQQTSTVAVLYSAMA